ncbi:glycosyltransferase family 4 protein [Patescibacteria group bacterium]|nr:glycosyltransferase family 4 protein [Patescibacteria group bacterium]
MKILMPVLHYPPVIGGFEVFSQSIAERIGKTEDVFLITSRVVGVKNKEKKDRLTIFRTSPFKLKDLSYSKPWFIFGSMIWIFFKSLRLMKKIDLIHAQGFLSGIIAYFLFKFTKKPYIITIQSADFSVYHPRLNINIIKYIYCKFEKAIFKNAVYGHAVSNHLEKHLKRFIKKTIVIPNGVSKDFKPDLNKKENRKKLGFDTDNLICCVSRLEYKNGTHDLIEAAKHLKGDFKIIIIGSGSEKEKLEKMIKDFKLEKKVFLLGDMVYAEIPKYVALADIFVRPSLAEGFGIVFLEAMAVNVPVIGTPVGGIPDFLKHMENGLFCEPGNPKDIAEKINLLKDKELKEKLIKNGKKMVDEIYDWDKISKKIFKLYENCNS